MEHYKNISLKDIDGESWGTIPDLNGAYEVSTMGRIRGVERIISSNVGCIKRRKTIHQAIKSQEPIWNGYLRVGMVLNGKKCSKFCHRLVAKTFIPNIENKEQINHKNGIKTDNRVENLEWCTRSENMLHSFNELKRNPPTGLVGRFGKSHPKSKAIICINSQQEFGSILEAARELNITPRIISIQCRSNVNSYKTNLRFKYK